LQIKNSQVVTTFEFHTECGKNKCNFQRTCLKVDAFAIIK